MQPRELNTPEARERRREIAAAWICATLMSSAFWIAVITFTNALGG